MFILNGTMRDTVGKTLLINWAGLDFMFIDKLHLMMYGIFIAKHGRLDRQLDNVDSVFIGGGDTPTLIWSLENENPIWKQKILTKTVVAQSAGVSALMQYSFNIDYNRILRGTGILPYSSIVHFSSNKCWMVRLLEKRHPEYPILLVDDYSHITVGEDYAIRGT